MFITYSDGKTATYVEDFPVQLLHQFPQHTGIDATSVLILLMEYGRNFSGPGNDIFRLRRATGEPAEAHNSNFLHPVLYYYSSLPTGNSAHVVPTHRIRVYLLLIT